MNLMKIKAFSGDIFYINVDTISVIEPVICFNEKCTGITTDFGRSIIVDGNCEEIAERVSNFYRKRNG